MKLYRKTIENDMYQFINVNMLYICTVSCILTHMYGYDSPNTYTIYVNRYLYS